MKLSAIPPAVNRFGAAALLSVAMVWWSGCQGPAGSDGHDAALPDSLSPVIEWLSPTPGTVVDTAVTLLVRAYDRVGREGGVVADTAAWRTSFYLAGMEYSGEPVDTGAFLFRYHWAAEHYPEAPYPVSARVWDYARNSAGTPTIILEVRH